MSINFSQLFSTYSKRQGHQVDPKCTLSPEFRRRVLFLCRDTFYAPMFWEQTHKRLQYLHGQQTLSKRRPMNIQEDAVQFLSQCNDEHFLDFVEMMFQYREPGVDNRHLVVDVNNFLQHDDSPYALTDFVYQSTANAPYFRAELVAYPRVIRRENEVLHGTAIEPALEFLSKPGFASANQEFLDALEDYRKSDFPDCLTKCGSSFESVMKVICDRKGWYYKQEDTAGALLRNICPRTALGSSFEQQLLIVPTLRNRYGNAHGKGTQQGDTPKHIAQFAINATASAILLLVEETNL